MSIDCAFYGFLSAEPEPRIAAGTGTKWTRLRVGVGQGENVQWVQVAVFGDAAESAAELEKSDRVYVEGTISIRNWQDSKGEQRYGLNVASHKCERTHNIGRNRKTKQKDRTSESEAKSAPKEAGALLNDEIPF